MRVVYKVPGEMPKFMDVANTLETLQGLVGGFIEPITLKDDLVLLVNEEGKICDMQPNFFLPRIVDTVVGPAVFVGAYGEDFTSISENDAMIIMMWLKGEYDENNR